MFNLSFEELKTMGAEITTREIKQQPELWQEVFDYFISKKSEIEEFLKKVVVSSGGKKVKVIFTGAGTSEYIGETIYAYLQKYGDTEHFDFLSIGTTDIVSCPEYYFYENDTVLLVSFARSGNSPESVATVNLAEQLINNVYHLTITCAADGALAKRAKEQQNNLLLLMPERSNDAGFAMTGSFSCMMLTSLLVFDLKASLSDKERYIKVIRELANDVITREEELQHIVSKDFNRIVYLGSGCLKGLTHEAQLKILELTAGQIATLYDSSMGFRHGPKSFVDEQTIVITFVNNDPYVRQYDLDILEEVYTDQVAVETLAIAQKGKSNFSGDKFDFVEAELLPDAYLAFPMIFVAQIIALLSSVKVKNLPDTPSATGTVNRVVKGVTIHPFEK